MKNIKMLFCHIYIGSFAHERIRQIGMYFPRYLLGSSILTACIGVIIKNLGKYLTICLILSFAKQTIYRRPNSIFIFYINTFQRKYFTKFGLDSGFACERLVGVFIVIIEFISVYENNCKELWYI